MSLKVVTRQQPHLLEAKRRTGEPPVEGVQQVQLGLVCRVDEDALNGEEAAVFATLGRRVRYGGVEEASGPLLTAAGTCGSEVTFSLEHRIWDGVGVSRVWTHSVDASRSVSSHRAPSRPDPRTNTAPCWSHTEQPQRVLKQNSAARTAAGRGTHLDRQVDIGDRCTEENQVVFYCNIRRQIEQIYHVTSAIM